MWCSHCKSNTHAESLCRKKGKADGARKVAQEKERDIDDKDRCFVAKHASSERPSANVRKKGIMVDAGATSHIVNDITTFQSLDSSFQPDTHSIELADGKVQCDGSTQRDGADLPTRH